MESKTESKTRRFWASLIAAVGLIASIVTITGITLKDCIISYDYYSCTIDGQNTNNQDEYISNSDLSESTSHADLVNGVSISLNSTQLSLKLGESYTLIANVHSLHANTVSINWSSNNDTVASVSSNGTVTANKAGIAIISATTDDGEYTAQCTITVTGHSAENNSNSSSNTNNSSNDAALQISNSSVLLDNGQSSTLYILCSNSTADLSNTQWTSSNSSAISISPNGSSCVITANDIAHGVKVTATNTYGILILFVGALTTFINSSSTASV